MYKYILEQNYFIDGIVLSILCCFGIIMLHLLRDIRRNFKTKNGNRNSILLQHIANFQPDPLTIDSDTNMEFEEDCGKLETFTVDETDEDGIDLAKVNYLNMLNNQQIKKIAIDCITKYGVGTCGPRGFFGTTEIHLELESNLASFLGMEEAIIYAYGFAAPSNSILAYCKRNDVIFCDEKINFALEQGVLATRALLIYFKHNNVDDLRHKLQEFCANNSSISHMRKFLIIEGIYAKTGTICPLPPLISLAKMYKLRVIIDECISFGVLGEKGRGVAEHFKVDILEIDMIIGSFEGALGSIGSFCASSKSIIEHQRLSSTGYVFSASLPTFQTRAVIAALKMIDKSADELFHLQLLSRKFHNFLSTSLCYVVHSNPISPYKVFNYNSKQNRRHHEQLISDYCRSNGVYLILNDNGLMINLNVSLFYQKSKVLRVFDILESAVIDQPKT